MLWAQEKGTMGWGLGARGEGREENAFTAFTEPPL